MAKIKKYKKPETKPKEVRPSEMLQRHLDNCSWCKDKLWCWEKKSITDKLGDAAYEPAVKCKTPGCETKVNCNRDFCDPCLGKAKCKTSGCEAKVNRNRDFCDKCFEDTKKE